MLPLHPTRVQGASWGDKAMWAIWVRGLLYSATAKVSEFTSSARESVVVHLVCCRYTPVTINKLVISLLMQTTVYVNCLIANIRNTDEQADVSHHLSRV